MPDVIFWVLFGWLMLSLFGRAHANPIGCGRRPRLAERTHGRVQRMRDGIHGQGMHGRFETPRADRRRVQRGLEMPSAGDTRERVERRRAESHELPRRLTREETEAGLRARYVSGDITVEQYENELDNLYRRT